MSALKTHAKRPGAGNRVACGRVGDLAIAPTAEEATCRACQHRLALWAKLEGVKRL